MLPILRKNSIVEGMLANDIKIAHYVFFNRLKQFNVTPPGLLLLLGHAAKASTIAVSVLLKISSMRIHL